MPKNNVVCLKYGNKYSAEYVNKLYNMVTRNLSIDFEFYCITDDRTGVDKAINIIDLQTETTIQGWWYKPFIFDSKIGIEGTILFFDLDVIIFNNIDKLFEYEKASFCIIKDFYAKRKGKNGMNSSCFRFEAGTNENVYTNFIENAGSIMRRLHGDQDLMQETVAEYKYWPEQWIQSFKWEMVNEKNIRKTGEQYYVDQNIISQSETSSVAVFHGNPNPHVIQNSWIEQHWR